MSTKSFSQQIKGIKNAKFNAGFKSDGKIVKKSLQKVVNRKVNKFCCFHLLETWIKFLILYFFPGTFFPTF